ncbi:MAG TPA: hypothetical protein VMU40_12820 [Steroidobacteraceae bacterium]|nr:hypothetical protein [Steroidobacteraceae bacterium]
MIDKVAALETYIGRCAVERQSKLERHGTAVLRPLDLASPGGIGRRSQPVATVP